jgi:hypothetical protein
MRLARAGVFHVRVSSVSGTPKVALVGRQDWRSVGCEAVTHLLRLQAERAGLHMSVRELLRELAGIEETVLLYQGDKGRPKDDMHRLGAVAV